MRWPSFAMKMWPYKRSGLSWGDNFSSILVVSVHLKSDLIRGVSSLHGNTCMTGSFHKGEVWVHKANLTPYLFFFLKCLYQARKVNGHVFVLVVSILLFPAFFLLYFGIVPTVWYFSIVFWNCSNSVVFFVFQFINRTVLNLFIPNMEF